MTHPALRTLGHAFKQPALRLHDRELCRPVLADIGMRYPAAKVEGHALHAVAQAEDGYPRLVDARVHLGRVRGIDAGRPAGKDQRRRPAALDLLETDVVRDDLRVDARLTHAPRYELRILRTEIENEDRRLLVVVVGHAIT